MRVSSNASTPQPSARSVARGPAPTRQTWGVEHANCPQTRVSAPTHGRLLVGASHGGAPSSLPRISSQGCEKGSHEQSARASGAAGGRKHVGGSAAGPSGQGRALGAGQGKTSRPCAAEPIWRSQRGGDGGRQRRVGVRQRAVRLADRHRPRGRGRRLARVRVRVRDRGEGWRVRDRGEG